jgi:hypothetical protein
MARFIKRENLPNREKRKLFKQTLPFDINANFVDNMYEMPLQIEVFSKNFSFKDDISKIESLQNPNIVDSRDFNRITNSKLELNDKFDNQNDPLFDLDDSIDVLYSANKFKNNSIDRVTTRLKNTSSTKNISPTSRYKK